jgi:hypothetical protein
MKFYEQAIINRKENKIKLSFTLSAIEDKHLHKWKYHFEGWKKCWHSTLAINFCLDFEILIQLSPAKCKIFIVLLPSYAVSIKQARDSKKKDWWHHAMCLVHYKSFQVPLAIRSQAKQKRSNAFESISFYRVLKRGMKSILDFKCTKLSRKDLGTGSY